MKSRLATIVILILFAAAAALLVFFAPFIAHGQPATNLPAVEPATPVATELTPQAVAQSFTAWNAVALLMGKGERRAAARRDPVLLGHGTGG